MTRKQIFSRYLSTDGTTSGTKDMSTTADDYYILDTSQTLYITRLLVWYQDGTGGNISEYGNLNAALTTGIIVQHIDNDGSTVVNDLTDGLPVKTNGDWARLCYDYTFQNHGTGDDMFTARWTFEKAGDAIILQPGERLNFKVQDDLTNLTYHYAIVQGHN